MGRKTTRFAGGKCHKGQPGLMGWYFVLVGTATLDSSARPKARSFEVAVDTQRAGTYSARHADVRWTLPGKSYKGWKTLKVTVMPGLTRGLFSGVLESGMKATGAWRC